MYKQTKGVKMSKVRMNTELRNKLFNRIKDVFEKEDTQEREAFLQAREDVTKIYPVIFAKAKEVVERSYPAEDVQTCRTLKSKYGQPLDVVAKDKCFYFSYASDERQSDSEDEDNHNISEHFDFGLYGKLTDSGYRDTDDEGKNFAYAMNRVYLNEHEFNPDIICQQSENQDNPHKTKHIEANDKALGYSGYSSYNSDDNNTGISKAFDSQWALDIIGTSHCRSRTIGCTENEFQTFQMLKQAKARVVSTYQSWIKSVDSQCKQLKAGLKAYRYLVEGVELATELGIKVDEAELIRSNSTGLTIYNPQNLASMIKAMKNNRPLSKAEKIIARQQYEAESVN